VTQLFPAFGRRAWIFGVLNVTPDSFSDGGRWDHTDTAIEHGIALAASGADVIDVGGESTRPGAHRIDAATEAARVIPVIKALSAEGAICSVDTTRAEVAQAAVEAGALILNDVSGGLADPGMARVAAETGAPWILMHWRGHSADMQRQAHYGDVVKEVRDELLLQVDRALAAGVDERSLILDPGLGFAKDSSHNWRLLKDLDALVEIGLPVLVGASRKRFLGELLVGPDGEFRPAAGREAATAAVSLLAAQRGTWGIRVHEPRPTLDALEVLAASGDDPQPIVGAGEPARSLPEGPLGDPDAQPDGTSRRFGHLGGGTGG
jgi:dihydropteroate synthase